MAVVRREPNVLWALFALDGRINREVFWLCILMCNAVTALFLNPTVDPQTNVPSLGPLSPFTLAFALWVLIAISVKRLHDRGLTGWIVVAFFIPIVGLITLVVIGLMPGNPGPNTYARATNQRGT